MSEAESQTVGDADVLRQIAAFQTWRQSNPTDRDGLDQMLALLQDELNAGRLFAARLMLRLQEGVIQLGPLAAPFGPDLQSALSGLQNRLQTPPEGWDADPVLLACGAFLDEPYRQNLTDPAAARFEARKNALFGTAFTDRRMVLAEALRGAAPKGAQPPLATSVLTAGYNLGFYADSFQLGQNAWGDGAEIVQQIAALLTDPHHAGQGFSLWPPGIDPLTDLATVPWLQQAAHQAWVQDRFGTPPALPAVIKEAL